MNARTPNFAGAQRGFTLMGGLVLLVVGGFIALTALRAAPYYYDYVMLKSVLNDVAAENGSSGMSRQQLWGLVSTRLSMNNIDYITDKHFSAQRLAQGRQILRITYDARTPLVGNATLLLDFDYQTQTK
ncbi:MAG: DUF4845 domain-containing protein [Thiotrichales bacterium]